MTAAGLIQKRGHTNFPRELSDFARISTLRCVSDCGPIDAHSMDDTRQANLSGWLAVSSSKRVSDHMLAKTIMQGFLTRMAEAVIAGRFDVYSAGVQLPFSILTSAASLKVETIEELEEGFDDFSDMVLSRSVTRIFQTVQFAGYESKDRIVGVHQTRLMDGQRLVLPEYYSKMWIKNVDGVWKATKTHNTTKDARWPMLLTRLASEPWPPEEI